MNIDELNRFKTNNFFNFEPKVKSNFKKFYKITSTFRYFGMISIILLFFYFYSPKRVQIEEEKENNIINEYINKENELNQIFYN